MGGWGTSLFQRDPSWKNFGDQDEANKDREKIPEDQREVQLEEYQSWSKGSWDTGNRDKPAPGIETHKPEDRENPGERKESAAGGFLTTRNLRKHHRPC
jgi:hypothetical protein